MTEQNQNIQNKDEIDLIELALKIWTERKLIYKTISIFLLLGITIAFGSKKEYKASTSFILEDVNKGSRVSGLMGQFGGLAGLNLGNMEQDGSINPELYPKIIKSTPFIISLLKTEFTIEKYDTTVLLYDWFNNVEKPSFLGYIKEYTFGLPSKVLAQVRSSDDDINFKSSFDEENIIELSQTQNDIINDIRDRINISSDENSGIINLSVMLPDAQASAELTRVIYSNLTKYLIDYKVNKGTQELIFIEERCSEAKSKYEDSQKKLAQFKDQNLNVSSSYFNTKLEKLENDFDLSFAIYKGLAQQLEQKRIEVQETMPVFKKVNYIEKPLQKEKPKVSFILASFILLGTVFSSLYIILIEIISKNKS